MEVSVEQLPASEDSSGYAEVHGKVSSAAPLLHKRRPLRHFIQGNGECGK